MEAGRLRMEMELTSALFASDVNKNMWSRLSGQANFIIIGESKKSA